MEEWTGEASILFWDCSTYYTRHDRIELTGIIEGCCIKREIKFIVEGGQQRYSSGYNHSEREPPPPKKKMLEQRNERITKDE